MCGVFASISSSGEDAACVVHAVLSGLASLQYRGYDSAGIGWLEGDDFAIHKVLGDVDALKKNIAFDASYVSAALSHTRWATHGKPSLQNAHPMQSERFMLVHNGVLDHHITYRDLCISEGFTFVSETDSEVLVMMMERAAQSSKDPMESWVPLLLSSLPGQWSITWMDKNDPCHIYAYSHGRPLVVSHNQASQGWISSDIMSLVPFSDMCSVMKEDTLVKVSGRGAWALQKGEWVSLVYASHGVAVEEQDMGNFPHYMLKEIYEQPLNIKKQYMHYEMHPEHVLPILQAIQACSEIMIVGCGSSFYAGGVARYAMEKYFQKRVSVDIASEFNERTPVLHADTLVIVISQSGETADTLTALEYAQQRGIKVVALCNVKGSAIALAADYTLFLWAGVELGVASTKAFCAQVFALLYLTRRLYKEKVEISDIEALEALMSMQLGMLSSIKELAIKLAAFKHLLFIARDHLVPIAYEAALKYKEITYIHAEAYAGGELKHGPLALIDAEHPTIALVEPQHRDRMMANIEEIRARGGEVFIFEISDPSQALSPWSWPDTVPEWLHPLAFLLPVQLLAYESCVYLGYNVDRPRNLAKCVTVE